MTYLQTVLAQVVDQDNPDETKEVWLELLKILQLTAQLIYPYNKKIYHFHNVLRIITKMS